MFSSLGYTLVMVSDMARSVAFYRDTLGLALRSESESWSEFDTGETTLALHHAGEPAPPGGTEDRAGTCFISFATHDLEQTARKLEARGLRFSTPPTARPEEGLKVAICEDPDGLRISIVEETGRVESSTSES